MEPKSADDVEVYSNDSAELTPGKPESVSLSNSVVCDIPNEVQLAIEYAELEGKAAAAMKRAADAKKAVLTAIRGSVNDDLSVKNGIEKELDENLRTKLTVHETCSVDHKVESTLERLVSRLELPKCEMPYFTGSPLEYIRFFRQFDDQIERHVSDDNQRLTYLHHYCKGKAKQAIEGCLMYPGELGYGRARRILHDLFGQRHCLVRALLEDITNSEPIKFEAEELSTFANKLSNCVDALEQLNYTADLNSVATIEKVLLKLPRQLLTDWVRWSEDIYNTDREPVFRDLSDFVTCKAKLSRNRYSHLLQDRISSNSRVVQSDGAKQKRSFAFVSSNNVCIMCDSSHKLDDCVQFKSLNVRDRWSVVLKGRVCFVCLRVGHQARSCRSSIRCSNVICKKLHHSLLHQDHEDSVNLSCKMKVDNAVSLGIVPVKILGNGTHEIVYAMLDSGSDTSLVSRSIVDRLRLDGINTELKVATTFRVESKQCLKLPLTIMSLDGSETLDVPVVYSVPKVLSQDVVVPDTEKLTGWKHLSDVRFDSINSFGVDLLLGLDVPEAHWIFEQRRGQRKEPYADRTLLGWVLRGPIDKQRGATRQSHLMKVVDDHEHLNVPPYKEAATREAKAVVVPTNSSLKLTDGHFCAGIPWLTERKHVFSPDSVAGQEFSKLSNKLKADECLYGLEFPPLISEVMAKRFYMDNCLSSVNIEDEVFVSTNEMISLFAKARHELTGWVNNKCIMEAIPEHHLSVSVQDKSVGNFLTENHLSIMLNVKGGCSLYCLSHKPTLKTKHGVCSRLASLYNALGLVWPLKLQTECTIQTLCIKYNFCDEPFDCLKLDLRKKWKYNVSKCVDCRRFTPRLCTRLMVPLSTGCIESMSYLLCTGVVVYLCFLERMSTDEQRHDFSLASPYVSAMHIGVTRTLFVNLFVRVLSRFIVNPYHPTPNYSDNESNCRGARTEIELHLQNWSQIIIDHLATNVDCHFDLHEVQYWCRVWQCITPSLNCNIDVSTWGVRLTDEVLVIFLGKTGIILKDCFLISVIDDTKSLKVLTTKNLLLLKDNITFVDIILLPTLCIHTWIGMHVLSNTFSNYWKQVYHSTFQFRYEWYQRSRNFKCDDFVFVTKENIYKTRLLLWMNTPVIKRDDGKVREVVKTSTGELRRDVRRLCLLEGSD